MPAPDDIKTPIHPGEILLTEFLEPMGISQYRLAHDLKIPQSRVSQIVKGKRGLTVDTAMRLARYFDMSIETWLNMQRRYELEVVEDELAEQIRREVRPMRMTA